MKEVSIMEAKSKSIFNKIFVNDPAFYRKTAMIALPIAAQSMITIGINLADTVMVGELGDTQLSAVGQANQFVSIFQICCMGLGMGASVLTSRFWGMKDKHSLKKAITIMLRLTVILAIFGFTLPTILCPRTILNFYLKTDGTIEESMRYFSYMAPCYLLLGLSLTCTIVMRTSGQVRVPMFVSIGAFFVNVFFNWVFIFGKLGAPEMGVAGAGLGTLIARFFEFLLICGYMFFIDKRIGYRLRDLFMKCGDLVGEYISISIPVLISDFLLALGNSMVASIMGRIGDTFVAANSITVVTQQLSTVLIQGICQAGCIITGHTLGEGRVKQAQQQAVTFYALGAIVGSVGAVIILAASPFVINFYNVSDETKGLAAQLMDSIAIIVVFQAINSIMTKGVLRGGGDTKFLMVADILFLWVASIPLGYAAGLEWHLNAFWIYFFLKIDQVIKAFWCILRLRSGKWIKRVKAAPAVDEREPEAIETVEKA